MVAQGGHTPGREELQATLGRFTGVVRQTPPKFSAVKVNGERAYDLARKHLEFEIAEREVTVFSLVLVSYDGANAGAALEVVCSGGTYVRSLVQTSRTRSARLRTRRSYGGWQLDRLPLITR